MSWRGPPTATVLVRRLVETPGLTGTIRSLPARSFSALVRKVGVEDAGEIIALATTEQIVEAFDEDLFVSDRPGEREVFDVHRFVTWLEVILEAGDGAAATRVADLSEPFVIHALSSLLLVLDEDALRHRMALGDAPAFRADKALEGALSEEIDGYVLVSRIDEGWDAALSLVLALDRDHRSLLVRLLDRCADIASEYVDDLDALTDLLTKAESLAEDVEAERDERRSRQGWVEPRAARAFLASARESPGTGMDASSRDPLTRAHFRDLPPASGRPGAASTDHPALDDPGPVARGDGSLPLALPAGYDEAADPARPMLESLARLRLDSPPLYAQRLEEMAYLANVLVAGAAIDGRRMRPAEAAEAALVTVALGAELEARRRAMDGRLPRGGTAPGTDAVHVILLECPADLLFRRASSSQPRASRGFLLDRGELASALERLPP